MITDKQIEAGLYALNLKSIAKRERIIGNAELSRVIDEAALMIEALAMRPLEEPDVERVREALIEAARTGGGSYRRDIDCLAGNPERLARAAIAAITEGRR